MYFSGIAESVDRSRWREMAVFDIEINQHRHTIIKLSKYSVDASMNPYQGGTGLEVTDHVYD